MLVGRQSELSLLSDRIAAGRSVCVVGAAGIGKTALLREASASSGRRTLEGGALASLDWIPFLPVSRALGEPIPPGDLPSVAAFVRERVDGGVLVLDDLHWSDADTLALLPLLTGGVTVLAAARIGDTGTDAAQAALRDAGFELLVVEGLENEDASALVHEASPHIDPSALAVILRSAGGNPFLLFELAASPEPSPTLQLALRARLGRCTPRAQRCMSLLALIGRPARSDLLGAAVHELVDAGLVRERRGEVEPRHALLGETVLQELAEGERRALHAQLAEAIEDDGESARHYAAAGEPKRALKNARRAAASAERPGERASHLGLAAECATGPEADELRLEAADALIEAGRFEQARAIAGAVESEATEIRARAALQRGRAYWGLGNRMEARREFDAGIALVHGQRTAVEARLMLERLRDELYFGGSNVVADARAARAVALFAGAELVLAGSMLGTALCWHARSSSAVPILERAFAAAETEGDLELCFEVGNGLCGALQQWAQTGRLEALQLRMEERARDLGLRRWERRYMWMRGQNAYLHGEYELAIELLQACVGEPSMGQPDRDQASADLATALADVGRFHESFELLAEARAAAETPWGAHTLLFAEAEAAWLAGQPGRSLAAAEEALSGEILDILRPQHAAARDWALLELGRPPGPFEPGEMPPFFAGYVADSKAIAASATASGSEERLFLEAAEAYRGNVFRNELRSLWAAAEIAIRDGAVSRGRHRLLDVEERAEAHAAAALLGRVRRSLRKAGVHRSAARTATGTALTRREREVMQLVASGLTSAEIALKLGVAPATIESIVRSSMTKLNAKTRTQAAVLASEPSRSNVPA